MKLGITALVKRLVLVLLLLCAVLPLQKLFAADAVSPWFKNSDPEFSVREKLISDADYPASFSGHGNIDCDNLSFTKRDGDLIDFSPLHKESKTSGCYVGSSVGPIDDHGYMNVGGTDYVAETVKPDKTPFHISAFPNSDVFISNFSSSPALGNFVWFDHLSTSLVYSAEPSGKIFAVVNPRSQTPLTDKSGALLPVMADNFSASDNGQWLVVDSPNHGLLRINLATMEALPFADSFELDNGTGAAIRTSITSDGRYVAVASKNYHYFKLYDLETCAAVPTKITKPVACESRDLNAFVNSKITGMNGILQMRFLTDNLIQFYASYTISSTSAIGKFIVAAPNTYLTGMDYLAMGDSYSSGEGAQKYEIGTDEHNPDYLNLCHLSRVSYPYLIAKQIQANNFHSVACSGAKTLNIQGGKEDNQYNPDKKPQNNALGDWLPGYKKQIGFISINNPSIVTLGVGGNDINFSDKLIACLKPGTCFPAYEERQEVFNEIDGILPTLTATFTKTKSFATKNARIYVVGYPQIALATGNCGVNVHLNQDELVFASSVISRLNTVIVVAAEQAGVNYINIEDAFEGYRLCENNSGNIAMNGLTAGNDKVNLIGNESYHPNEFGHQLIANKILSQTNNLGTLNPASNPNKKLEKIKDTDSSLKNTAKTGRTLKKRVSVTATPKSTTKGKKVKVSVKGVSVGLPPKTPLTITVGGTETGTTTTDDNGDTEIEITIPPTIENGPTTVDITGTDITGQSIDLNTIVIVGNEGTDFDGDNIPDASDSCPAITNANQDVDQDGTDDACDPKIGPAPISPSPSSPTSPQATGNNSISSTSSTSTANIATSTISIEAYPKPTQTKPDEYSDLFTETKQPVTKNIAEKVLSATTNNISQITDSTHRGLLSVAATHPIGFSLVALLLLFILLCLTYLYIFSSKSQPAYSYLSSAQIE